MLCKHCLSIVRDAAALLVAAVLGCYGKSQTCQSEQDAAFEWACCQHGHAAALYLSGGILAVPWISALLVRALC